MRALSTAELLTVWELGSAQPLARRALTLLAAASDDPRETEAIAQLSLGARDARLLELREAIFGSRLTSLAACPHCRETLEFEIETRDLRSSASPLDPSKILSLTSGECAIEFRLPTSRDLAALDPDAEVAANRLDLLGRCLVSARRGGHEISAQDFDAEMVRAISERMAAADPQADLELALVCPSCQAQWTSPFEIVAFFWSELQAWATRVFHDVHALASTYGWREADILSMSPIRRQTYLDLIQA